MDVHKNRFGLASLAFGIGCLVLFVLNELLGFESGCSVEPVNWAIFIIVMGAAIIGTLLGFIAMNRKEKIVFYYAGVLCCFLIFCVNFFLVYSMMCTS